MALLTPDRGKPAACAGHAQAPSRNVLPFFRESTEAEFRQHWQATFSLDLL